MSHDIPKVATQLRERTGTRYAKRLRRDGLMPAVVYGHGEDPVSVAIDAKEILTHLHHGLHVYELNIDGKAETCLVKDLQFGYLGDNVIHIDFARVNMQEEVTVHVQLTWRGTPKEAAKAGAILRHDSPELTVACKVIAIPDEIPVNLETMDGTTLTAGEIPLPDGVRLDMDPATVVASVTIVRDVDAEGEAAEVGEGGAEPEVISEASTGDED